MQKSASSANNDASQLRDLAATFAVAFNGKDVDAMMAAYAHDASLFVFDVVGPPGAHFGWDAYRDAWEHFFARFDGPVRYSISDFDVHVSGDVGYSRSLQHVSGVFAHDGATYDVTVRVTDVYRRIDGQWVIVQEHASLPLDRRTLTPIPSASLR